MSFLSFRVFFVSFLFFVLCWLPVRVFAQGSEFLGDTITPSKGAVTVPLSDIVKAINVTNHNIVKAINNAPSILQPNEIMGDLKVFSHSDYVVISIEKVIYENLHYDIDYFLKKYDAKNNKALVFLIDSRGGDYYTLIELQKMLDLQRVTTVVVNRAFSAGALLFLLGKNKFISPEGRLGLHSSSLLNERGEVLELVSPIENFARTTQFLTHYKNKIERRRWATFLQRAYRRGVFNSLAGTFYSSEYVVNNKLATMISSDTIVIQRPWLFRVCHTLFM